MELKQIRQLKSIYLFYTCMHCYVYNIRILVLILAEINDAIYIFTFSPKRFPTNNYTLSLPVIKTMQWVFTVTPRSNVEGSLNGTPSSDTNKLVSSESRTSFEVVIPTMLLAFLHNCYHTVMDVLLSTCCYSFLHV